jgi:NhaP-type Na+/H+ or K+/H+ antiporter
MTAALAILTNIAIILLLGLACTILSKKLKISNVLILIVLGLILKSINYKGNQLFEFSPTFLIAISILALAMITFDGASRLNLKEFNQFSTNAVKLVFGFILANTVLLTIFTNLLFYETFTFNTLIFSLIFAVTMAGTDPGAVFSMLRDKTHKVIQMLKIEAIMNTPIIVLVPFILLDLVVEAENATILESFASQTIPFLRQIVVGIGAGVIIGIVIFKAMKNAYEHNLSPLGIITATLLSYILAENLGGNGVLSVATMGLLFGNMYVRRKITLQEFSSTLSNSLEILVFVLLGFLINIELSLVFIAKSLVLFVILVISRKLAVFTVLRNKDYTWKQMTFMALNMPKGMAVAVVAFSFTFQNIPGLNIILDLMLMFILYSLILSSIIDRFSKHFINLELEA